MRLCVRARPSSCACVGARAAGGGLLPAAGQQRRGGSVPNDVTVQTGRGRRRVAERHDHLRPPQGRLHTSSPNTPSPNAPSPNTPSPNIPSPNPPSPSVTAISPARKVDVRPAGTCVPGVSCASCHSSEAGGPAGTCLCLVCKLPLVRGSVWGHSRCQLVARVSCASCHSSEAHTGTCPSLTLAVVQPGFSYASCLSSPVAPLMTTSMTTSCMTTSCLSPCDSPFDHQRLLRWKRRWRTGGGPCL